MTMHNWSEVNDAPTAVVFAVGLGCIQCLCYREQSGQLSVGLGKGGGVAVFDVLCR